MEDTEAMTIDEKSEIEAKVADALDANFETHDMVARAHSGENSDEESEDEMMQREEKEKSGEGIGSWFIFSVLISFILTSTSPCMLPAPFLLVT